MAYTKTQTDDRGITTVTLDRPDFYNAMNRAFIDELQITLDNVVSDTRILIIAGAGKHFCAGADINWMKQSVNLSDEQNQADAMALSDMLYTLNTFPHPTVARVQGAALGGGTGLICCCDIVVASETARFAFTEVNLGILPATISPYAIAAIGSRAARRYFLTAEYIDSLDAYKMGLVHDVCSTENLDRRVQEKVSALLQCAPQAQGETKKLIADVANRTIDDALRQDLGARLASIRAGEEAQEGLGAFMEKREPKWR